MPFTEEIKWEVKRKAHFKCCWCQQLKGSLDAHHIIPENDDGPSTIENAAPLCKECHDTYGSNPSKRTEIRNRRDFWYEKCEKILKYENIKQLEETYKIIVRVSKEHEERLKNVESDVKALQEKVVYWTEINQKLVSDLSVAPREEKSNILEQIATTSSTITSGATLMKEVVIFGSTLNVCPYCGEPNVCSNHSGSHICQECGIPFD